MKLLIHSVTMMYKAILDKRSLQKFRVLDDLWLMACNTNSRSLHKAIGCRTDSVHTNGGTLSETIDTFCYYDV